MREIATTVGAMKKHVQQCFRAVRDDEAPQKSSPILTCRVVVRTLNLLIDYLV